MDDIVAITLFRHGLTEANKRHAYLGWTDSPLCPLAKEELREVSATYHLLFSSDLERCLETARRMFPNAAPVQMRELREMNFGCWEGKVYEELKDDREYQQWLNAPSSIQPPYGESFTEFSFRVMDGWEKMINKVLAENVEKAAIMTHGGVIRLLLTRFAPEVKDFWDWTPAHGKGYKLIWNRKDLRRGERCTLLQEVPLMANPNGSMNIIN